MSDSHVFALPVHGDPWGIGIQQLALVTLTTAEIERILAQMDVAAELYATHKSLDSLRLWNHGAAYYGTSDAVDTATPLDAVISTASPVAENVTETLAGCDLSVHPVEKTELNFVHVGPAGAEWRAVLHRSEIPIHTTTLPRCLLEQALGRGAYEAA